MPRHAGQDADPDPDGYLQRAELLAELGRYVDAATELGFAISLDPDSASATTMLARVQLADGRPVEALAAAESAIAAAPGSTRPLVVRGLALVDLRRFTEAGQVADELLALGATDPYAQASAAAILAEARNGQPALNAAWRSVELAPGDAPNHLVLGLVSARLGLYELAERAYGEALRLDPALADANKDVGVIRLEQRRYSVALEQLAEAATVAQVQPVRQQRADEPARMPITRPTGGPRSVAENLRQLVLYGAGYAIVAAILTACLAAGNAPISRVWALLAAAVGFLLVWRVARRVPGLVRIRLPALMNSDRTLAFSVYAVLAAPCLILLYALIGTPWPLVLAIIVTAVAQLAVLRRSVTPPPIS